MLFKWLSSLLLTSAAIKTRYRRGHLELASRPNRMRANYEQRHRLADGQIKKTLIYRNAISMRISGASVTANNKFPSMQPMVRKSPLLAPKLARAV
jgi:hypothetical protein